MFIALLVACSEPIAPPGAAGPYRAGATTFVATDSRGRELKMEVWYPTDGTTGAPGDYSPMTLQLDALRNAEPLPGPWPMVAFSHGSQAIRFQSAFLTEHLATHGFVVVAPDHARNTMFDNDDDAMGQVMLDRPDDIVESVELLLSEAASDGLLAGVVEDGDWAIVGHSFGALTSLIVGGGVPDIDSGVAHCDAGYDGRACDVITPGFADLARETVIETDPRVVTTVAMSPLAWYAFGPDGEGLQSVKKPLILGGTKDPITGYAEEIEPVFESLGEDGTMLVFDEAGHYPFSDICLLVPLLFEECDPEAGFADLATVQAQTNHVVTAHLHRHLLGDKRYQRFLIPEAWSGVEGVEMRWR